MGRFQSRGGNIVSMVICLQLPEKRGKDIKMLTAQKNVLCLCKLMTSLTSVSNPFSFIVSMVAGWLGELG